MTQESDDLTRDPVAPAYAAGWVLPSAEVPLDEMRVGPASSTDWPIAAPESAFESRPETVSRGTPSETPDTLASGGFDVAGPVADEKPAPIIASALLDAPQQEGLKYLLNYANKSIRKNRGVAEQDRDDLLHEIYMEWWVCVGFEVAALPKLLASESPERQSLRESIYRVFGRYRYHLTARRTEELDAGACLDPETLAEGNRDFVLDLDAWLGQLPTLEAKIIDLYYFQHKTMEEIGAELGLAKQRISEIHKRALSRHPNE
ncbi:MAG TPA: sigma-70 family RNA polymerase sigma factor [Gemmataceae bacterium]|nr:sigma-70 family RNA polymerase sigma factor [Gemmataceae bacterium]